MTWTTSLKLTNLETDEEIVLPIGSYRGISQTLAPIDGAASMRRTVNGDLVVLRNAGFQKFRSEVSGSDIAAPALGGLWPGAKVRIESVAKICERVAADGSAFLSRDPVPGSVVAIDRAGKPVPATYAGRSITAPGAATVSYRPILNCALFSLSVEEEEMTVATSWSLELEEL